MDRHVSSVAALGDGVLNVRKSSGWSSHDVVAKLRSLLRVEKMGHAGTLDPAATGVLPILIGRATRIAEYLLSWDKEYRAVLRLGETTDTQDATGTILDRQSIEHVTEARIFDTIERFRGPIKQMPPMYSAIKVGGVPLYRTARAGRTVARESRKIVIHDLKVLGISGREVTIHVHCSKGTYVRTLCADIGEALGVGGHLLSLERQRVGPLVVNRALSIEEIESLHACGKLADEVMSTDAALQTLPALMVDHSAALRVLHGVPVPRHAIIGWEPQPAFQRLIPGQPVRVKDDVGRLLGIGRMPSGDDPTDAPIAITKVLMAAEGEAVS